MPDSSSNRFEDTVRIKTAFSLFKVLESKDRIDCNEINLLKALKNRLVPFCAAFSSSLTQDYYLLLASKDVFAMVSGDEHFSEIICL